MTRDNRPRRDYQVSSRNSTQLVIPDFAAVVLVGPSGSGKSHFARKFFKDTEILSSDLFRKMLADSEEEMSANADTFAVLYDVLKRRLARRLLTVIDATNLRNDERKVLLEIIKSCHASSVGIHFDVDIDYCKSNNKQRDNPRPERVIRNQFGTFKGSNLNKEGFSVVYKLAADRLQNPELSIARVPLRTDKRAITGPFDIIGDVHGCWSELESLLSELGYLIYNGLAVHPDGRRLLFLGDLVDRGPDSVKVLKFVMGMVASEPPYQALWVRGNHDDKILRHLQGRPVTLSPEQLLTMEQINQENEVNPEFIDCLVDFLDAAPSHLWLDDGKLVIAHAGIEEPMIGKAGKVLLSFTLYGQTTGETDDFGLPVRQDWAANYSGKATIVYGHSVTVTPKFVGKTICLDSGCCFGGKLTALRYPEKELVSVPALKVYVEPVSPLVSEEVIKAEAKDNYLPEVQTLLSKYHAKTRFDTTFNVTLGLAAAAFETLALNAVAPNWLIFVPPTTGTVDSSAREDFLERPEEALDYYKSRGVPYVVAQFKHMGSRAVVILCKDKSVALRKFGDGSRIGVVLTKTCRPFFDDVATENYVLEELNNSMTTSGLWEELETDWIVIDGEMLPWSMKAGGLIRNTFAAVSASGISFTTEASDALTRFGQRTDLVEVDWIKVLSCLEGLKHTKENLKLYEQAWSNYCKTYNSVADLHFAPFAILATEGKVWADVSHVDQMVLLTKLAYESSGFLHQTPWMKVDLNDEQSVDKVIAWWEQLTRAGHEGLVFKAPTLFPTEQGLSPSLKVRGSEYLRIIYGHNYLDSTVLPGLKKRSTGNKRRMARTGLALSLETLSLFVEGASLQRVYKSAWAALALHSEEIDVRL